MLKQKIKLGTIYILLLLLMTACGHPIPAAPNDILSHKKSILVLTSPSLDNTLQTNLVQTFNAWKQSELITSEWIKSINVVDELLINKINKTAYSYIIVFGNELSPTALAAAAQSPEKRWIVLSDPTHPELNPPATPDNVALHEMNTANLAQNSVGTNVLNHSVGAVTYQTLNGINVPTTVVQVSQNRVLNWNAVMKEQLNVIQTDNFEKGIHFYNSGQMVINH
jgi:hypothetical protein